jgi:hypothetical protein
MIWLEMKLASHMQRVKIACRVTLPLLENSLDYAIAV